MKINPNILRKKVIDMVMAKKSGHIGGAFSMAELTSVLYEDFDIGGKDKLILSKGHAVPILYAALHELGKISDEELDLFREIDSPLQGHPDKERLPLMDATTGSLGQGLSIAIGHSIGKNLRNEDGTIFCILGDGELQEGQVWEALQTCVHHKIDNLWAIVDVNEQQVNGAMKDVMDIGDIANKIESFGAIVTEIDGHNFDELSEAKKINHKDKPLIILAKTSPYQGMKYLKTRFPKLHYVRFKSEEERVNMNNEISTELGISPIEY